MNHYTEIIQKSPLYKTTAQVRDINLLMPVVREKILSIIADAATEGITLQITETYRSKERQEQLFAQGKSKLQKVGVHHYGLAADLVVITDGKADYKRKYDFLGRLAHKHGLIWGGDWGAADKPHTFIDAVHVQFCALKHQKPLFDGIWYPDNNYNPYF